MLLALVMLLELMLSLVVARVVLQFGGGAAAAAAAAAAAGLAGCLLVCGAGAMCTGHVLRSPLVAPKMQAHIHTNA